MPLLKEWIIDHNSLAAIWKIEEPESFFAERTNLTSAIPSEKRRMEHLAGRFLLKHLKNDFPLWNIRPDEHDKPRIDNNDYYFSISHSFPYVAVVINSHAEAGIDVQTWHPAINRIRHKFLSSGEQELLNNDAENFLLGWSVKEAVYKWQGRRGVDFIDHLPIIFFKKEENVGSAGIYTKVIMPPKMVTLNFFIHKDFVCAYVAGSEEWVIY